MQGPGRPALVPFQDGLRPKDGDEEGGLWWGNVPDGELPPGLDSRGQKAMLELTRSVFSCFAFLLNGLSGYYSDLPDTH